MVTCSCGKQIEKVPNWLDGVNVKFVCNNCPDREIQSIADIKLPEPKKAIDDQDAVLNAIAEDLDDDEDADDEKPAKSKKS